MKLLGTILLLGICFVCKAQSVTDQVVSVTFFAADTTLQIEYLTQIDGGLIDFEKYTTSRRFNLKLVAERDSLNNEPLVDLILTRMGVFLNNQFPEP